MEIPHDFPPLNLATSFLNSSRKGGDSSVGGSASAACSLELPTRKVCGVQLLRVLSPSSILSIQPSCFNRFKISHNQNLCFLQFSSRWSDVIYIKAHAQCSPSMKHVGSFDIFFGILISSCPIGSAVHPFGTLVNLPDLMDQIQINFESSICIMHGSPEVVTIPP